jgi:hypothetical protein
MKRPLVLLLLAVCAAMSAAAQQKTILFDAKHAQTAGNADWTLDEDICGTAQRFPTPDQAGITPATPETFWSGAHSAMGIDLVKKGFHVESLPVGARISFGDGTNAQDLSHYNVFVMPEPNIALTPDEITAIRNFVQNGGGLFMIADHAGADRNSDGIDAAGVFNALMGNPSVFGITYNDNKNDKVFGWFDDAPDGNFTRDSTSPIIKAGAFGIPSPTRGLGLFGSSTMTISGAAKGHVWKTTSTHDSTIGVTYATSTFGSGRVAAIGDSSITEDATNGCGHKTFLGYDDPKYDNGLLVANGIAWLAGGGVSQPPQPPQPPGNGNSGNADGTDISGWKVTQASSTITFTIPAGTVIPANGYVVIARNATKSAFESFWGVTLGANVVYLNGAGAFPQINGSESYTLKNKSGTVIDGPTIAMPSGAMKDLQRKDPCTSAHTSSNWTIGATTNATPGSGGGTGCAKGVIINELSDAVTNFNLEFVELRNDK